MPKKNVTLKDIAKAAGVTAGTVSFVLTNTHEERRIAKTTVEKVRRIARKMGYLPNIAARNLRRADPNKGLLVLSIITSTGSPLNLVSHIFEALQKETSLDKSGRRYMISIGTFNPGRLRDLPGLLDGSLFNGAIITNTLPEDDRFLEKSELPYPTVIIGREIPGYSCFVPSVNAGRVAAQMLLDSGCRQPAVLFGRMLTQATERRVTQFCDEYRARSGAEARRLVTRSPSEAAATDALDAFLKEGGEVDGVFAVHDSLAAGAYLALRRYALAIPQQVRVVGMGDSDWPEFLDPPLSCAGAEESEVYGRAAKMILEACEPGGREPETIHTYARVLARGSA